MLDHASNLHATLGLGAHNGAHIKRGGKALQLGGPVVHKRRGAYHERGLGIPRFHARQNVRDHLQRFAQAHIVGQDAAKAQVLERAEPLVAVDLIAAQRGLERDRHRKVHLAERIQALDGTTECGVAIGFKRGRAREHSIDKKGARRGKRHAVEQVNGVDAQVPCKAKRGTSALVQAHDIAGRKTRERLVALIRIEIDGKVGRRKPARTQLDVEQVALDGGTHRELGRRAHRNLAQAIAEHDIAKLGQSRQSLGQQAEQASVITFLKRKAAFVEIEVQGRRVHGAKFRHRIARRNTGALLFERTARSTKTKEIRRPIAVGHRNLTGHESIVDANRHGKARLGRHVIERSGRGQVGVVAQDRQRHAAELAHLVGGDMDRRAAGQQVRQERRRMLGKRHVGTARAARIDQIGCVTSDKAVRIGRQAQVVAATRRRCNLGGKERRALGRDFALPLRRRLDRHLAGAMRRRPPRPSRLKGHGPAAQQVQHGHDGILGYRQLTLGDKAAAGKVVRCRARTRDVAQVGDRHCDKVEQLCRHVIESLGHMGKRKLLAIGERTTAHISIGHAVDILNHVGHRTVANAKLERPVKAIGKQRIVVRHQRGLQHRFGRIGVDVAGELATHGHELVHARVRKIGKRCHKARARGDGRREGKVGVDRRCAGR